MGGGGGDPPSISAHAYTCVSGVVNIFPEWHYIFNGAIY